MLRFKHLVLAAAVILAVPLCQGAALAADKAQVLLEGYEKMETLFSSSEGQKAGKRIIYYKEAGLSYQPSVVAPILDALDCKDQRQLAVLMGIYTMDRAYAMIFGRKDEVVATTRMIGEVLPERLQLSQKLKVNNFTPEELKAFLDNPDDPANRELYAKYPVVTMFGPKELLKTDPQMVAVKVSWHYGIHVEAIYLASKLALSSGSGEKLVALYNQQAFRMETIRQVMATYAGNLELAEMMDTDRRQAVLQPVLDIINAKKGRVNEDDIRKILATLEPERAAVVAACK
jgi:hypothetical protein